MRVRGLGLLALGGLLGLQLGEERAAHEAGERTADGREHQGKQHIFHRVKRERRNQAGNGRRRTGGVVHDLEHSRRNARQSAAEEVGDEDGNGMGRDDVCLSQRLQHDGNDVALVTVVHLLEHQAVGEAAAEAGDGRDAHGQPLHL